MFPNSYFPKSYFPGGYFPPAGVLEEVYHLIYASAAAFSQVAVGSTFNVRGATIVTSVVSQSMVVVARALPGIFSRLAKAATFYLFGDKE